MNPKWMIFLVTLYIVLAMLGGVIELAYLGAGQGAEKATLNVFLTPFVAKTTIPFIGNIWNAVTDLGWWGSILTLVAFDFVFFEGTWGIFRWIFFIPIGIAILGSFTLALVRGVSSA